MAESWESLPDAVPAKRAPKKASWEDLPDVAPAPAAPSLPKEPEPDTFAPKTMAGTVARKFIQGASFGFGDELAGVSGAINELRARHPVLGGMAAEVASAAFPPLQVANAGEKLAMAGSDRQAASNQAGLWDAMKDRYAMERDAHRHELEQSEEAHPVASTLAELGGSALVPLPGSGKAKGLTKLGKYALQGAAGGALSGAGASTQGLDRSGNFDAKGLGGDIAKSTMFGSLGSMLLGPLVEKGAEKVARGLTKASEQNALKAIGLRAGISSQLEKRGYETADEARALGKAALDMDLIPFGGKAEDVARRAAEKKTLMGQAQQSLLEDATKAAPFDPMRAQSQAALNVHGPEGLSPEAVAQAGAARRQVDRIGQLGQSGAPVSFNEANQLKSDIYDAINFGNDPKLKTRLQQRAASGLRQSIEDQVGDALGDQAKSELQTINRRYGELSDIAPLAREEANRQLERKSVGMGTLMTAAATGAMGAQVAPHGAALGFLPLAYKAVEPRLGSVMARSERFAAPLVAGAGKNLTMPAVRGAEYAGLSKYLDAESDKRRQTWLSVQGSLEGGGDSLGPYAKVFQGLDEQKRLAMHQALMAKDPKYRDMVEKLGAGQR